MNQEASPFSVFKVCLMSALCVCLSTCHAALADSTNDDRLVITLIENSERFDLLASGACSSDEKNKTKLSEMNNPWPLIVNKPYLEKLSALAILEQVKQQVQQTRVVVTIDQDKETKLIINGEQYLQTISLHSVDVMHQTYPDAKLLTNFIEVVNLIRQAKALCSV